MMPSSSYYFLMVTIVLLVTPVFGITLYSSLLSHKALCPGESDAIFTCITVGGDLIWEVSSESTNDALTFSPSSRVGNVRHRNGHIASILRINGNVRTSILSIGSTTAGLVTVKCSNVSSVETLQYYHGPAGLPSQPVIITNSMRTYDVGGADPKTFLNMSWTAGSDRGRNNTANISHYVVHVDGHLPSLFQNTSATIPISSSPGSNHHIVRLQAVDMCGQSSDAIIRNMSVDTSPNYVATEGSTQGKRGSMGTIPLLGSILAAVIIVAVIFAAVTMIRIYKHLTDKVSSPAISVPTSISIHNKTITPERHEE